MPHKLTKAGGKLLFVENKKALRSIDRFEFNEGRRNVINQAPTLSQQILILSRLVEDTKLKGIFLVTLTIFGKK